MLKWRIWMNDWVGISVYAYMYVCVFYLKLNFYTNKILFFFYFLSSIWMIIIGEWYIRVQMDCCVCVCVWNGIFAVFFLSVEWGFNDRSVGRGLRFFCLITGPPCLKSPSPLPLSISSLRLSRSHCTARVWTLVCVRAYVFSVRDFLSSLIVVYCRFCAVWPASLLAHRETARRYGHITMIPRVNALYLFIIVVL